uniref:Uncharacterized protein n=1 Tax=Daphnia galeata TaxID=27404 RepID=A0A8J2RYM3_9CRUS|nr:unnamed protein product [Daphnia galeata]
MASNYSQSQCGLDVNFREHPEWQGSYDETIIGQQVSTLDTNVTYHVIIVSDQPDRYGSLGPWVLIVPVDWIDLTSKHVLYPHPTFHLHGIFPQEWSEMSFCRRRFPTIKFVEYMIADFVTETAVTFEEATREAKSELEKVTQQAEQPDIFQDSNQYDLNEQHSRQGYYQPSVVASPEVRKSTYLERTGQDIEEPIFNCNTPENHPNWQRRYGNQHGSSSFQPSIASGSSRKSTGRWSETPLSSSSYVMPAGVRQLQNTAPPSRDSLRASSVASVSVTGSLNRCVPVSNNLEKTVCEVPTQQPSSSARMLPRVLPSAQSGPTNGDTSIQAHGSKRNVVEHASESADLSDIQYKRKVIKLFEEVVAVMKKSNRGHQNIDFPIETAILQHFHHFEKVLTSNVKLPLQQYNEIEDLNSALANNDLSIAMCAFYSKILKTMSSRDQISKMLMSKLFTNTLCTKIQWKRRGNDKRPGFGHLTNLVAVMGVIINIVREINKLPKVDFKDLIVTIQTARRMLSFELKNKNTSQMEVLEDEVVGNSKTDRQTQLAVDGRMAELYNAILHFELN